MDEITYLGEHLWPGRLGTLFAVLSFAAAIVATIGFFMAERSGEASWKQFARWAFRAHSFAVVGIMITLFYILFNHLYEYRYAWEHLNNAMPIKYVFSCFWEGQEGSFLLWTFWHMVLGNLLIRWSGKWETSVMTIFSLVQIFLASMLVGVYFGDFQFGQNPFELLRESENFFGLPWTFNEAYLQFAQFQDGRGLNPLLQNYWMTIHPPITFLGFASTLVPFCFVLAGLWKRDYTGWLQPAIPWTFFGVAILGTGILMGGAWAYEALGFGGFWAWDPVENSSLVPWLVMAAGAHLLVINKRKPTALFACVLFIIGPFILILYSTFLTRSGVLGDTSVHSFVESGILPQLLVYLLVFVALATMMMIKVKKERLIFGVLTAVILVTMALLAPVAANELGDNHSLATNTITLLLITFIVANIFWLIRVYAKQFPRLKEEEDLWSREFWMFVGALIFVISAIHISFVTSIPIWNKLLEPFSPALASLGESWGSDVLTALSKHNFRPPSDVFITYHKFQVPLAALLVIISGAGQWFKYKKTDIKVFAKKIVWSLLIATGLTVLASTIGGFSYYNFGVYILLGACIFSVVSNFDYILRMVRGKVDLWGASVAHIGFGLMLIGAVVSTSQQHIISKNSIGDISQISEEWNNNEDMAIYQGDTLDMGPYFIVYRDRELASDSVHLHCYIDYFDKKEKSYHPDDLVWVKGAMFLAVSEHVAGETFLDDMETSWSRVPFPNPRQTLEAQPWVNGRPAEKLFTLTPSLIMNGAKGTSREPSIKHFIGHDLYTFLEYIDTDEKHAGPDGYFEGRRHEVKPGDRVLVSNIMMSVDSLLPLKNPEKHGLLAGDLGAKAVLSLRDKSRTTRVTPFFVVRDSIPVSKVEEVADWGLKFRFDNIDPHSGSMFLTIWEHESVKKDFIVMKAMVFPQINVLWIGCLIMVLGTFMAVRHRIKLSKRKE
jgi:cytochrome c-type biogenesis protein CcmF